MKINSLLCLFYSFLSALACVHHGGFELKVKEEKERPTLKDYEDEYLKIPSAERARQALAHYASVAHIAGTLEDKQMAEWTKNQMLSYGLENVTIHEMETLLSYPNSRKVEMYSKEGSILYKAPLSEEILEEDSTSDTPWRNLSFNGYAPSGEALAQAVYANYGRPEDFMELETNGVNVTGKVVIVRYGKCFRGLKVMNAQTRGAIAVIIYSDPADDGYNIGKTYPDGPWRSRSSVQRGSVQFLSLCAGDPSRAINNKNVEEVCGYKLEELIPQIPVLPVSYGDIEPIMRNLGGKVVSPNFEGALKISYRYGPTENLINVVTNNTFTTTPIWNVIAYIKGSSKSADDQPIILGNHRDAWVFGAADPNSGSSILLEVARGLAHLRKNTSWRPKRSIILCSWSGEEYGLVGSTGWAETFASTLLKRAVAYLNVDVGISGRRFRALATPALSSVIVRALKLVEDPRSSKPVYEIWNKTIGTLGSGSDYTVFLDHLGIASIDMAFTPDANAAYGVYHSIYDSYHWVATEADPTFEYHQTMALIWGLIALELSTEPILPFNYVQQGKALQQYLRKVHEMDIHESLDFSGLNQTITKFGQAALSLEKDIEYTRNNGGNVDKINERIGFAERSFLHPEGLPKRKWFKHVLQSPGLYLGYAADVFPGVTQAIRDGNFELAQKEIAKVGWCVRRATKWISNRLNPFSAVA